MVSLYFFSVSSDDLLLCLLSFSVVFSADFVPYASSNIVTLDADASFYEVVISPSNVVFYSPLHVDAVDISKNDIESFDL